MESDEIRLEQSRIFWDQEAATFDNAPDHGLRDPSTRKAWSNLLIQWLPEPSAEILDIGCGTGSLSVLFASFGHHVTGIDLSPAMISQAKAKAEAGQHSISFQVMEASRPNFSPQKFNVVVCRHLLWTLQEPARVLKNWVELLKPGGRLILIEGYWHTGGGLHSRELLGLLPAHVINVSLHNLSKQAELWGKPVKDERYSVIATLPIL